MLSHCDNTDTLILNFLHPTKDHRQVAQTCKNYFSLVAQRTANIQNFKSLTQILESKLYSVAIQSVQKDPKVNIVQSIYKYFCFPKTKKQRQKLRNKYLKYKSHQEWNQIECVPLKLMQINKQFRKLVCSKLLKGETTIDFPLCDHIIKTILKYEDYFFWHKDINGTNMFDKLTRLHIACKCDNLLIIKYLIAKGAFVDQRDCDGNTPLMFAAFYGNKSIVEYLITHGANIEARNNVGCTAVGEACKGGYLDIAKLLISNAASFAIGQKHNDVANYLLC